MASRFPCPHETWANKRAAEAEARKKRNEPLVMGSTPNCLWCVAERGAQMARQIGLALFVDELMRTLQETLSKTVLPNKAQMFILKEVKTKAELLLQKVEDGNHGADEGRSREAEKQTDRGHGEGNGPSSSGAW